jgi:hypothetical protein
MTIGPPNTTGNRPGWRAAGVLRRLLLDQKVRTNRSKKPMLRNLLIKGPRSVWMKDGQKGPLPTADGTSLRC